MLSFQLGAYPVSKKVQCFNVQTLRHSYLCNLCFFCQTSDSSFRNEFILPNRSGRCEFHIFCRSAYFSFLCVPLDLPQELNCLWNWWLLTDRRTRKTGLNLAGLVLWATRTAGMAQKGQPHASLVMSSSVTPAFSSLCASNLWYYKDLAAVALLLTHFPCCGKKPWLGVLCVNSPALKW